MKCPFVASRCSRVNNFGSRVVCLPSTFISGRLLSRCTQIPEYARIGCFAALKPRNFPGCLYSKRFFRTFGAASKPLRSANPLSIREERPSILELLSRKNGIGQMACRLCLDYWGTTTCFVSSRQACTESAEEPI
jgi:hypothetical protein